MSSEHGPSWEQPSFGPVPPYAASDQPSDSTPSSPVAQPKWHRQPWLVAGVAAGALVAAYSLSGPRSQEGGPTDIHSPTPAATALLSPSPTPSMTPSTENSTYNPSPAAPTDPPNGKDTNRIVFMADGENGGIISAPAISWGEGYSNIIRFVCNDSIATADLRVEDATGKAVKTFKKKATFTRFLPRLCIGDVVSENAAKHPAEYYPTMLALILAKNNR